MSELIQGTFQVFSAWAGMEAAVESLEGIGNGVGKVIQGRGNRPVAASPEQHALTEVWRRSESLVREFPHLGKLAPTEENIAGMKRLADLFDDVHLTPELREQFLAAAKAHVGAELLPPLPCTERSRRSRTRTPSCSCARARRRAQQTSRPWGSCNAR